MKIIRDGNEYELTYLEIHRAYKEQQKEYLINDIKEKADAMGVSLEGVDINRLAHRTEKALDNNDGLWESYWMSIEYTIENTIQN